MGWQEESAMSKKKKFVAAALEKRIPFSTLCKQFYISRECGYKLLRRYNEEGLEGLKESHVNLFNRPLKLLQRLKIKFFR